VIWLVNQYNYYGPPTDLNALLDAYLDTLQADCCRLPLADVDDFDPQQSQISLDAVYTMLEVASTVERRDDTVGQMSMFKEHRQQTTLEAVSIYGRLILLGEPGGGKSTFVNFLTLVLAQSHGSYL
jgi:predicted NACHT family NTPase